MVPSRDEIETRIESLAEEVAALRRRVTQLEVGFAGTAPAVVVPKSEQLPLAASGAAEEWTAAELVGLAGRTLVVLGGAFLLRAVSSASVLPELAAPALGLLYATWWIWQADRDSAAGAPPTSAFFHGLTGLGIAYPLIWETTARFHLMPGAVAAPAIVFFLGFGLFVASRRSLRNLAWVVVAASLATSLALLFTTWGFVLYSAAVVAVVVAVEIEGNRFLDRWPELRWGPAAVLDGLLVILAVLVSQPRPSHDLLAALPTAGVTAVAVVTPLVYLASVAISTLVRRREISIFEIVQVGISLVAGIGTALTVIAFREGDPTPVGVAIAAIGLACYAIGFGSIDSETHPRRNFYAYTSFAGVLVLVGSALLLEGAALATTWVAFAWTGIVIGIRLERNTLRFHGALYLAAAAMGAGLLSRSFHGLLGAVPPEAVGGDFAAGLVAASAFALDGLLVWKREPDAPHWSDAVPRAVAAAVMLWSLAGWLAPLLASSLLQTRPGLDAAAWTASIRTAVLSVASAAIAWSGRRFVLPELTWLVYPLMVFTGGRMVWEDLAHGAPVNLFLAFGFYGGALILASRLHRKDT